MCRLEDQRKVRRAIALQGVDPADVPASAKVAALPMITFDASMPGPSSHMMAGQKRKHQPDVAETSWPLSLSVPNANTAQAACGDEDEEATLIEPEPVDELYCVMKTSIVGIQYYKGVCFDALNQVAYLLGEQVLLRLENKSGSSGSRRIHTTGKIWDTGIPVILPTRKLKGTQFKSRILAGIKWDISQEMSRPG